MIFGMNRAAMLFSHSGTFFRLLFATVILPVGLNLLVSINANGQASNLNGVWVGTWHSTFKDQCGNTRTQGDSIVLTLSTSGNTVTGSGMMGGFICYRPSDCAITDSGESGSATLSGTNAGNVLLVNNITFTITNGLCSGNSASVATLILTNYGNTLLGNWDSSSAIQLTKYSPTSGSPTDKLKGCQCSAAYPVALDPIRISTGNLFEEVTDFETKGANQLRFQRFYNSLGVSNTPAFMLGNNWRSTYDRYLRLTSSNGVAIVTVERADGQAFVFTLNGSTWVADSDVSVRLFGTGNVLTLMDDDDTVETYSLISASQIPLVSIVTRDGYTQSLNYGTGYRIQSVTDSFSRSLQFTYDTNNLLSTVTAPDGLVMTYGYNTSAAGNKLTSVSYSTSPQTSQTYLYENASFPFALTGLIDEKGNRFTTWTYDSQGRGTSSQHAGGADYGTVSYNDADGSRTLTDALGVQMVYRFTTLQGVPKLTRIDRLATATTPAASMTQTYDAKGYLANVTDWNTNLTSIVNDSLGQPLAVTEAVSTAQARVSTNGYLSNYRLPSRVAIPNKTTDFTYDSLGNPLTIVETDASTGQTHIRTNSYDSLGHLLSTTSPRSDVVAVTRYVYDTNNNLVNITNALGHITKFTSYNVRGLPLEMVDPNGVTNRFTYTPRGWLLSRTVLAASGNATNSFVYDAAGQMTTTTLPDGSKLFYQYDTAHRLQSVSNILGESITYTLDAAGNITRQDTRTTGGGLAKTQSHVFDALGRMIRDIGASTQTNVFGYDRQGNRTSALDAKNNLSTQAFDALNRLVKAVDPLNKSVGYGYDAQDNLVSVTDPRLLTTTYAYNGFKQVISESSPDKGTTVYLLDKAGNRTNETDARGVVTRRTFDALDRVTTETFPASPGENITYSYDSTTGGNKGIGRLTGITDESGSTTFFYDARGNVVTNTRTIGSTVYVTAYQYDLADRVTRVTYPSGHVIGYGRDSLGRITSVTYRPSSGGAVTVLATNISYGPFGPMTGLQYGNGLVRTLGFDLDYRLTSIFTAAGSVTNQNLRLIYDAANNITAIADGLNPERSQTFAYDENYRLKQAVGVYGATAYSYDGVGNRLSRAAGGTTENYAYATTNNRLQTITKSGTIRTLAYNAAGNTSSDNRGTSTNILFGYGGRNRLTALTNGNVIASYKYNALGQRVIKTVSGSTTHFHYDTSSRLIAETNVAGTLSREYVWLGDMPLAQVEASGTIYYIHPDHLNTPQKMTDAAKNTVWDKEQQAFGELLPPMLAAAGFNASKKFQLSAHGEPNQSYSIQARTNLASGLWVSLVTNSLPFSFTDTLTPATRFYRTVLIGNVAGVTNNLRFPGQYYDAESGLNYNLNRDYDPSVGRYVQNDPIGLAGGISLYGYVGGNPSINSDPLGLWTFGIGFSVNYQLGPININFSRGFVIDGHGQIGISEVYGGGVGAGALASGGLSFSGSNAETICDLGGRFANVSLGGAGGASIAADGFSGNSNHGVVTGGGLTLGVGLGGGGSIGGSYTTIIPIGRAW